MMIKVLLLSVLLMGIVFTLFAIRILIKKGGKFPHLHIGGNKELSKRGIFCATTQDKMDRKASIKIKPLSVDEEHPSATTSC